MIVYPAIDLRGGRCVRLLQGEFDRETVYGDDPVAVARAWAAAGAQWLHVVDLDGARAGRPMQTALVRDVCRAHPGRVAIGLDARAGRIRVAGWTEAEDVDAVTAASRAVAMGAAAVVYTDVERDGTERGPDLAGTRAVARAAGLPVIASGGVGSLEHVRAVAALAGDGVAGVIIGRALYTGAVRLAEALAVAEAA